ncbi:hypothetical protein O1611_g1717 [Lasiodiplodia mahajangana]|uniref:Uncharacterized protein n=1 Tax=Lasiodiplodia mahajangana TaxID=1108764 RepID=A0ACC2JXG4_9PEZI|nr:hypothetical protein O1611_g1717 [Lasiodiplodia mahajangana]
MDQEIEPETTESEFVELGGYTRLAEHMGRQPQLAILRRFGTLANATLLYYQAEITELEHYLEFVQDQDNLSDDENRRLHSRSWIRLCQSAACNEVGSPERRQYEAIMKLRKLMGQYHKALYFHKKAMALRTPHTTILGDLREWMQRPTMGRVSILSWDRRTWDVCDESDLITFDDSTMDRFTSFITYTMVNIYHDLIGRHIHAAGNNTVTYTHRSIALFTEAFTVLIACSLPIAAIVILYSVNNMVTRLGIFAALTALFSISMSLLTMASPQEIFSATTVFAAVLVFFLGSQNVG